MSNKIVHRVDVLQKLTNKSEDDLESKTALSFIFQKSLMRLQIRKEFVQFPCRKNHWKSDANIPLSYSYQFYSLSEVIQIIQTALVYISLDEAFRLFLVQTQLYFKQLTLSFVCPLISAILTFPHSITSLSSVSHPLLDPFRYPFFNMGKRKKYST